MRIVVDDEIRSLIPPLGAKEQTYLEASLRTYGCQQPLKVWGKVLLDGHRRLELCKKHRIHYEIEAVEHADRDAALLWVEENQLARHDLSDDQRAAVAVRVLRRRAALRTATKAGMLARNGSMNGISGRTRKAAGGNGVAANGDSNSHQPKAASVGGVAKDARVSEYRVRDAVWVEKADAEMLGRVIAGEKSLLQARRDLVAKRRAEERRTVAASVESLIAQVLHGDFRRTLVDLPDDSVDMIFVDPPYDKRSIPLYGDLASLAARVLVPGGSLVCYAGVHALPALFPLMTPHLTFWWQLCLRLKAAFPRQHGWRVHVHYKPLLWFVKGKYRGDYMIDVIESTWLAKHWHDWQQSEAEAAHCISKLVPEGGLVLDPMCGSGTTLLAAKRLGRRYLGVEKDEEQAKVASARLSRDMAEIRPGPPMRS